MTPICPQCSARWYGLRDVDCRPICAQCGSRIIVHKEAEKK